MFKTYYRLTKPGIIYGNLITATAGFLLASKLKINAGLLVATLIGIALVIASACVFNNYIDRGIDQKMARTKNRALVTGKISASTALLFGTILKLLGFLILLIGTNVLTALLGLVGFITYVAIYGFTKRRGPLGTIIGSIAGAMPPAAGYVAVTNHFDGGALILFLILVFWQMPHFYAIAMYRQDDYAAAGIPVLPVVKGSRTTKIQILIYIVAFILATFSLTALHYSGYIYMVVMLILGLIWLGKGIKGFNTIDDKQWGRQMFLFSLKVLMTFSIMVSFGQLLP